MGGYDLELQQLRRAANAAWSGGDQLGKVDAQGSVSAVPAALPGSRSAGPIARLADSWRQQVVHWSAALLNYASGLAQSADLYAANDAAAAEAFGGVRAGGQVAY